MHAHRVIFAVVLLLIAGMCVGCGQRSNTFVIALSDPVSKLEPAVDAASERVRVLIFNALVRKNEKLDYIPELASNFRRSEDDLTYTFTLRDGVKFHDGRQVTSADAKYALDTLLASNAGAAAGFFKGSGANNRPYITSV